MKTIKNQRGQSLIEYLIIVALIAVGSIGVVRILSQNVYVRFANISNALQGKDKSLKTEQVQESHYKKRDLSDFFGTSGETR